MPHFSLSADRIIQIGSSVYITNTILATWVTMIVVIAVAGLSTLFLKKGKSNYLVIGGKLIVEFFYKFINGILGQEHQSHSASKIEMSYLNF